ncbi:MAG: TolC family protein [Selenomonadaceae bacterium]|nr:TolC family protein [Selenomonadaceae bacterium]
MRKKLLLVMALLACTAVRASAMPYEEPYADHEPVSLTLADSIGMALATSESIDGAEASRREAKWSLSAARRATGPSVGWNAQALRIGGKNYRSANEAHDRYGDPHQVTQMTVSGYVFGNEDLPVVKEETGTVGAYAMRNTFSNSWNLTIPIYTGGQLEGRMDASRYRLNQADLNLENTREEVRYQAAEAYANLLHQENLTKIAGEAVDMAKTQLRLISDQYSEGAVAKADVLMMEVQLANCRKNLVSAKSATEVARSTLASIVGLPQDTMIQPSDIFSYEPYPKELTECEEYALAHRPDGLAAEYAKKAAEAQKDAAKAGYRPRVTGSVGQSISSNHPFGSERSSGWEAGIGLSWSIFDNGVTAANVEGAKAVIDQAEASAEHIRKQIRLQTRSAYLNMRAAEENIRETADAVGKAEQNYVIAKVRYEEGVDILLNVTDAQERLTQARSNYYTALYQYNLYRAALDKAMGIPVQMDATSYVEAEEMGKSADVAAQMAALPVDATPEGNPSEEPSEKESSSIEIVEEMAGEAGK